MELIPKMEMVTGNGKVELIPEVVIENKRVSYNLKLERKIYLAERWFCQKKIYPQLWIYPALYPVYILLDVLDKFSCCLNL